VPKIHWLFDKFVRPEPAEGQLNSIMIYHDCHSLLDTLPMSISDAGLAPANKARINLATTFAAPKLWLDCQIYTT